MPAGRPKGAKTDRIWANALRKAALDFAEGRKGPKKLEMAARALVNAAANGDVAAAREFGDRLDGKVPQAVTGNDGGPIALAISWLPPQ